MRIEEGLGRVLSDEVVAAKKPFKLKRLSVKRTSAPLLPASETFGEAIAQVDGWLESPSVQTLHSERHHWKTLCEIARKGKLAGGIFHDARIAAICIKNGVQQFWTADRDFAKFKTLKCANVSEIQKALQILFFVTFDGSLTFCKADRGYRLDRS
jgi:predicted nucleic acid-binding protein